MEAALEKLTGLSHKLAEKMYEQTGGDGGGATAAADEDEVIDAEYVDVEDKAS